MFTGLAISGPLDGKTIQSESPYYKVAELNKLEPYVSMEKEVSAALVRSDVFCYEHYKLTVGTFSSPAMCFKVSDTSIKSMTIH